MPTKIKEIKLSKKDQALMDGLKIGTENETIINPFSGDTCELVPEAVALYDFIKGSEAMGLHKKMAQGLSIFRRKWSSEYMTLLD